MVGVFAGDAQQVNGQPADAQLELQGEFVKEFRSGLVGRALSNLQVCFGLSFWGCRGSLGVGGGGWGGGKIDRVFLPEVKWREAKSDRK